MKTPNDREKWIFGLHEQSLKGGLILPEYVVRLCQESDQCFISGNYLATLILNIAGIEATLKTEFCSEQSQISLLKLINQSGLNNEIIMEMHKLRKFRNIWVHIKNPWDDSNLLNNHHEIENEIFEMSKLSIIIHRKLMYANQWI